MREACCITPGPAAALPLDLEAAASSTSAKANLHQIIDGLADHLTMLMKNSNSDPI